MPFRLICPQCGFYLEPGVAMKPECDACNVTMKLITGNLDEIDTETKRIKDAAKN